MPYPLVSEIFNRLHSREMTLHLSSTVISNLVSVLHPEQYVDFFLQICTFSVHIYVHVYL